MSSIVRTEFDKLLEAAGGSYLAVFGVLAAQKQASVATKKPGKNLAERKAAARNIIESHDELALVRLAEGMTDLLDLINNSDEIDPFNFTEEQAKQLMLEWIRMDEIATFLAAERDRIKENVMTAIAERNIRSGEVLDPELANGQIEVPELRKKFCKEAGGRTAPTLKLESDMDGPGLRELMGPDLWEQCQEHELIPRQVIEEHISKRFSKEKLMKLAETKPEVLEMVREALQPGEPKGGRMNVRDM